jgi:hypothetical protein
LPRFIRCLQVPLACQAASAILLVGLLEFIQSIQCVVPFRGLKTFVISFLRLRVLGTFSFFLRSHWNEAGERQGNDVSHVEFSLLSQNQRLEVICLAEFMHVFCVFEAIVNEMPQLP